MYIAEFKGSFDPLFLLINYVLSRAAPRVT
jgi:hypothetical protein